MYLFLYSYRYAKNLRSYFQEYARLIFENAENKDVKEAGNENEYRKILESPSSDEKLISSNSEQELDSLNYSDHDIARNASCGKECMTKAEVRKVENFQDIIAPHQWQHFKPFFNWLDNPAKLPEV